MAFKAKFLNRGVVLARLRRVVPNAERELAEAQLTSARELAERIKARAPVRTGEYRASIEGARIAGHRSQGRVGIGLRGLTKDPNATGIFALFRWRFLEFGTRTMARRPHVFPTYRAFKRKIRRNMANAVNRAIRRSKR